MVQSESSPGKPRNALEYLRGRKQIARDRMRAAASAHDLAQAANPVAWIRWHPLLSVAAVAALGLVVADRYLRRPVVLCAPQSTPSTHHSTHEEGLSSRMVHMVGRALWQGFMGLLTSAIVSVPHADSATGTSASSKE